MNKHTSGQWAASPEDNNKEWGIDSGKWGIAICADAPGDGTAEANARLIAAAPELFGIVERLVEHGLSTSLVKDARAAIAKATGDEK